MAQQQSQMENWRNELRNLNWPEGFSKEELMNRFPNIPPSYFQNVPSGLKFYSFNEFWDFFAPTGTPGANVGEPGAVPHTYPQQGYGGVIRTGGEIFPPVGTNGQTNQPREKQSVADTSSQSEQQA